MLGVKRSGVSISNFFFSTMRPIFSKDLLAWYAENARQLPWRGHPDPYAVWVSEIMLQQTRVETVTPYFTRWMAAFPTISALANASQQDVLNLWEGLGYYSRARNLHKAAQLVIREYAGQLPTDAAQLRRLPGIGRYTAGAIASIAFGQDEAALDGNIRRVLARLFDLHEPARSTAGERHLWELAQENLPPGQASEYNQALMDLGSMLCTPKAPICSECPLISHCRAHALGVQEQRPVKQPKTKNPHYTVTAAVIQRDGDVLIAQRPTDGLLGGMWEFPGGKIEPNEDLETCLKREICEELDLPLQVGEPFGIYKHTFTHFKVTLHAFLCQPLTDDILINEHQQIRWVHPKTLDQYPMGKIDRQISRRLQSNLDDQENQS